MRKGSLFHLLAKSPLLGFNIFTCYWVAFVVLFPTKSVLCHSDSICKRYGFPVINRKVLPFIIWFYHILLNNDVSLHNLVVLVVTIPTSPRLSKTEFVCGKYCGFTDERFLDRKRKETKERKKGGSLPAISPAWPAPWLGSLGLSPGHHGRLHGRPARPLPGHPPAIPRPGRPPSSSCPKCGLTAIFWSYYLRGFFPKGF